MVSQHWNTPDKIVHAVREVIGLGEVAQIDLDPCDNDWSVTSPRFSYKLPAHNGLTDSWLVSPSGTKINNVFCNPPYGTCYLDEGRIPITHKEYKDMDKDRRTKVVVTSIEDWVKRCHDYGKRDKSLDTRPDGDDYEVFLLVPASTETNFWFDYIWGHADQICFIKNRVKHPLEGKEVASSTKGSAMIYWGRYVNQFERVFEKLGRVVCP